MQRVDAGLLPGFSRQSLAKPWVLFVNFA